MGESERETLLRESFWVHGRIEKGVRKRTFYTHG